MPGATLEEMARSADRDQKAIIDIIVAGLDGVDRSRFLQDLTERVLALRTSHSDDDINELYRWIAGWWFELGLRDDPRFLAADLEATQLLAAGKLGDGMTGSELRARYRR